MNQQRLGKQPTAQRDVDKVRPAVVAVLGGKLLLVALAQVFRVLAGHAGGLHPVGWRDTVAPVPARWIVL